MTTARLIFFGFCASLFINGAAALIGAGFGVVPAFLISSTPQQ